MENAKEASIVSEIEIIPVSTLLEVKDYLEGKKEVSQIERINNEQVEIQENNIDFSEVKGQENVKRALEIAASGGHNALLIRKSWFAERLCLQKEYQQYYLK